MDNNIGKERLMISIATMTGIACSVQGYFGGWEFWVPGVVFVWTILLWWLHVTQKTERDVRLILYYVYSAFLIFFHGIHETSLFDVSVAFSLFLVTVALADKAYLLNLGLLEYTVIMLIQFYYLYKNPGDDLNSFAIMRVVFHIVTIVAVYTLTRLSVNGRISERKRVEKWQESAMESSHDMEDFLSNISHELRTPVNVISGMTTLLQKNDDSEELDSIRDATLRLANQIEDIQDYTEIKRGEIVLEEENYMCTSLVNDVVEYYKANYKSKDLELIIDLAPDTPTLLNGDIKKLHKIFRHLLDNAVKFTDQGGVYIKMFTVPRDYGVNLTIEFTDTGCGMTRTDIARVSSGLYQANKQRNRANGGIGIGFPVVYGFAHKMGGFVMIHSEKGAGTSIRVSVPQGVIDPTPCLSVKEEVKDGILMYVNPNKFKVPALRDFLRSMAVNLSKGLNSRLYSVADMAELEHMMGEINVSFIFTGEVEYEADKKLLDKLSAEGHQVVVHARPGYEGAKGSDVIVLTKPLFALPIVRLLNGEQAGNGAMSAIMEKVSFPGVSVLVVDDEPMNLVVAGGLFKEYGMIVDTAESGAEAVRKFETVDYDVIFMDHMMPEMDGVEAMKKIREIAGKTGRKPVIIALTANALSGAREMFLMEGFDAFIAKPIDLGLFERTMKQVLPEEKVKYEGRDRA